MAAQVESIAIPSLVRDRAQVIPWTLWCMALGCTSATIGAHWDISWHSSIGRDNFLTPAHIAIYVCGLMGAISAGWLILSHSFGIGRPDNRATVGVFGFRAPLGAFFVAWGGIAMLTSAPFDDWWHAAYGLDVKIISPPHVLLIFGFLMVQVGTLLLALGEMNRAVDSKRKKLELIFLYMGGLILITLTILILELSTRVLMHSAIFYRTVCLAVPVALAMASRGSGHRWGASIAAAVYTVFLLGFQWILPLFAAEPKLGPVFNPVTYFVPPQFPLLLLIPAFCCDLIWQRWKDRSLWLQAAVSGLAFLLVFMAVQYPFANFLMSDGAKNWFFGSHHFGYYVPTNSYLRRGLFWVPEETAVRYATVLGQAALASFLMTRMGLGLGNWMRAVQR
jgi:uncharacterized membrane protein